MSSAASAVPSRAPRVPRVSGRYSVVVRILLMTVLVFAAGNLVILAMHLWFQRGLEQPAMPGVGNYTIVDDKLSRGGAPSRQGYEALAAAGVRTVVDLRAEKDVVVDEEHLSELGLTRIHLPVRDGQAPPADVVDRFLEIVRESDGKVFVHCGAGVGRTGTMVAAYLVGTGAATPSEAVRHNLAVGPPSLEQIAFAAGLHPGDVDRPPAPIVALSRLLDAPRRAWVDIRHSYTR